MASIAFPTITKSTRVPNGTTYSYVHVKPKTERPWLLFLHGFPSSSFDWRHQIGFFSDLGYGILAPDLLGYGGTDKPTEVSAYRTKKMSQEIVAVLDAEGVESVVGVAHDWGCVLLSRLANYFPERFVKLCFLSVGYTPPPGWFDIGKINSTLENRIGYPAYAYWVFFNDADAAQLINRDVGRATSLFYCENTRHAKDILCKAGATRSWFANHESVPLRPSFLPKEDVAIHQMIFDPSNGGYGPGLNWYRAQMANLNTQDESTIPLQRLHIQQRTLAILGSGDFICVSAVQEHAMRPHVQSLKIVTMDAGHWLQLQKPDDTNKTLKEFLEEANQRSNL